MMELTFVLVTCIKIIIGFHCANQLTKDNPLCLRLTILAPALLGFYALIQMMQGGYVPYWADVYFTASMIPLYAFVGALLSGRNWLNANQNKEAEVAKD